MLWLIVPAAAGLLVVVWQGLGALDEQRDAPRIPVEVEYARILAAARVWAGTAALPAGYTPPGRHRGVIEGEIAC
ncbi:hypothetical protein ABZ671_00450 [Micromonospora sp. NPDC006766]|uniref:hypothetical protein n=1 Tax=Micromonospora sp. NPDC006766 TaxID=3154778 RepID=UPI0033C32965